MLATTSPVRCFTTRALARREWDAVLRSGEEVSPIFQRAASSWYFVIGGSYDA